MKSIIAASLALALVTPALAEDWVQIAESTSVSWFVHASSVEHSTTRNNTPIITALMKLKFKNANRIVFERVYVRTAECAAGYGTLVTLSVDGVQITASNQFVLGGGSIAASLAEVLCGVGTRIPNGVSM